MYDARENHPVRSEYRLYYQHISLFNKVNEQDLLVLCQIDTDNYLVIITEHDSTAESQICFLFNLNQTTITNTIN